MAKQGLVYKSFFTYFYLNTIWNGFKVMFLTQSTLSKVYLFVTYVRKARVCFMY